MDACVIDEEPRAETGAMSWLEGMLEELLREKSLRGKDYSLYSYSTNEICYRDEHGDTGHGFTLVYAVKKDSKGTYLIEFEEVEKRPKGICHLNIYTADSQKSMQENRIFHAEFENENPLLAKAAAARYFMAITAAKEIDLGLLAQIKAHADSSEITF